MLNLKLLENGVMFKVLSLIYDIISTIIFVVFYPFAALIRLSTKKDSGTRMIKAGIFQNPKLGDKVIMFHAVSVGEVMSLDKLLNSTKRRFPDYKIVLTTGTKTGQELAQKKYKNTAGFITYFPFDIPFSVNKFLNKINPVIVLIAETELWPEFAIQCKKRQIPLIIINGRISDKSYGAYKKLKIFFKPILRLYSKIYTQSETDSERFISIGTDRENTEVMRNLKFDIDRTEGSVDIAKGNNRIFTAGSTHSGENEIIINVYDYLVKRYDNLKLIIAPRHFERIPEIEKTLQNYNYKIGYRSKNAVFTDNDIIILDTFGELQKIYAQSDIAFIGGSFSNTGGHNPLEAAIWNVPTVSGPSIKNFRDIYAVLCSNSVSKIVNDEKELREYADKLLSDEVFYAAAVKACRTVFERQKGAADFVTEKISEIIYGK